MNKITEFRGDYRWMSNFWPAPVKLYGVGYSSVEHAYQAAKTQDAAERLAIRAAATAGDAKRMGQRVTIRADWFDIRVDIMRDLQRQKYHNKALRQKLIATYPLDIEEGNTWGDVFWGICKGKGENWMGRILMELREEIINENKEKM